jgi:hypothetical protein
VSDPEKNRDRLHNAAHSFVFVWTKKETKKHSLQIPFEPLDKFLMPFAYLRGYTHFI